ncbi:MAG: hypothetical protein LBS93_06710 [Synergistaceae bacterium]|nr:hypothetical protein [Synergistaceae bacterium]
MNKRGRRQKDKRIVLDTCLKRCLYKKGLKTMALNNKLGIADAAELARVEEKISKKNAKELFESGRLDELKARKYATEKFI